MRFVRASVTKRLELPFRTGAPEIQSPTASISRSLPAGLRRTGQASGPYHSGCRCGNLRMATKGRPLRVRATRWSCRASVDGSRPNPPGPAGATSQGIIPRCFFPCGGARAPPHLGARRWSTWDAIGSSAPPTRDFIQFLPAVIARGRDWPRSEVASGPGTGGQAGRWLGAAGPLRRASGVCPGSKCMYQGTVDKRLCRPYKVRTGEVFSEAAGTWVNSWGVCDGDVIKRKTGWQVVVCPEFASSRSECNFRCGWAAPPRCDPCAGRQRAKRLTELSCNDEGRIDRECWLHHHLERQRV